MSKYYVVIVCKTHSRKMDILYLSFILVYTLILSCTTEILSFTFLFYKYSLMCQRIS